ncbi:hypothetical protein DMC30DRAFT_73310 [Rhodotorula diobovata]|uniref:Uncharacterized protein n=1 Tax=Rhodotorula diobovata TaxID=5288 RepID=A0A5C5FPE9_9BASI|nr:hypothetical protein DMC30DRAFT_73310 [Rhodotorula diobovata]
MAISSPLPSAALSAHPLAVVFSLDGLSGPAPPSPSSASRSTSPSASQDIFDQLDLAAGSWQLEGDASDASGAPGTEDKSTSPDPPGGSSLGGHDVSGPAHFRTALSDLHSALDPHGQASRGGEHLDEDLPAWMRETSGRVMAVAVGHVSRPGDSGAGDGNAATAQGQASAGRAQRRVAVGCEDGTVWVFAPPPEPAQGTTLSATDAAASTVVGSQEATSARRTSRDSLLGTAPSSPPPRSPLHSPPLSPSSRPWTPAPGAGSSRPESRRSSSSASLASLATAATARSKRVASASSSVSHSTSGGTSALTSFELVRSHSRPRKASATVSISTSSFAPSSHAHPHTSIGDGAPELPLSPPPPSSPPTSPSAVSPPLPHIVFSSPSRPPSTASSSLQSRKEARSVSTSSPMSPTQSRRGHSRAKGSIASGIGLWDAGSAAPSPREERADPMMAPDGHTAAEAVCQGAVRAEELGELRPVLRVLTAGKGAVVALEAVSGGLLGTSKNELDGSAVLVLRQSGHLTLVSLVDGSVIGSCDAGSKVASTSRTESSQFCRLLMAKVDESGIAICVGSTDTKALVTVDLRSLIPHEAIEFEGSPDCVVVVSERSGEPPVLVYPSSSVSGEPVHLLARAVDDTSTARDDSTTSLGQLPGPATAPRGLSACGDSLISWDETGLTICKVAHEQLECHQHLEIAGVLGLRLQDDGRFLVVRTATDVQVFGSPDDDVATDGWTLLARHTAPQIEGMAFFEGKVVFARSHSDGTRSLEHLPVDPSCSPSRSTSFAGTRNDGAVQVYRSSTPALQLRVTMVNSLSSGEVLLGYNTGGIALLRLGDLSRSGKLPPAKATLHGAITLLETVEFAGRQVVVAGSSSGAAGVWNLSDWDVVGKWQLFASPVRHFAYLDPSPSSASTRLSNTIAFISANSPVALVSLFPPAVLFTLPGTRSSVELLATTKDEILVIYEQGLARTCDIKSRELRRSMDRKTAEGVLQDEAWTTWFRLGDASSSSPAHPLLSLEIRAFLDDAARNLPWSSSRTDKPEQDDTPRGSPDAALKSASVEQDSLAAARSLAAALATFDLDAGADELLAQLGVEPPEAPLAVGLDSSEGAAFSTLDFPGAPWSISPRATAERLMQLVCVLRVFLNYPGTERAAGEAIVYFASCLADAVGSAFCPPSLDVLAQFWLDRNTEVQQAAKSLFGTYLAAMPDTDIVVLVEEWQDQLPSRQQGEGLMHSRADHALLIVGLIAVERFKLLSSSVLVDVANSVAAYLEEGAHPYHQAVAAELCMRGFAIWQNYVDAMALVRALFALAIGRNPATPNDLRVLARNATLHVAGINTPLFMTTLLHDILNASTASSRNATLKLLGFMIRKKPLVLYTNLPRVAEAVVKSLDPTISALRETVQQSATFILNELVRRFPSIDFHGKSQRLAVGTAEGAAIVFDLRTATRLYVLEGHTRPVTALSWSPDGHRLVTVSLEESRVVVWRVSGGLLGMFMAGTPARQGSGGQATPFKTYDFHVGDEALMSTAATLEWVVMEWPAERTVRLRMRETALNFGV